MAASDLKKLREELKAIDAQAVATQSALREASQLSWRKLRRRS